MSFQEVGAAKAAAKAAAAAAAAVSILFSST